MTNMMDSVHLKRRTAISRKKWGVFIGIGGLLTIIMFVIALISYVDEFILTILPYGPKEIFAGGALAFELPSPSHLFGTDNLGRDIFVRLIYGARISLVMAIIAVIIPLTAGTVLGYISGHYGGIIDTTISTIMDVMLAFPSIILVLITVIIFEFDPIIIVIVIGIALIPYFSRIVRGSIIFEKDSRTRTKHWRKVVLIYTPFCAATAIIETTIVGFLRLIHPTVEEWGLMFGEGINYSFTAPHLLFFPGLMIFLTVLGLLMIGEGLRKLLPPEEVPLKTPHILKTMIF